jgi:hypothetical protein
MRRLSEGVVLNRSGAGVGTAVAGSPEEKALADVIEKEMQALGLSVRREPFPVRRYEYGEVSLTVNGTRIAAVTLHSGGGTWGSRDGVPYARGNLDQRRSLNVELVDAGEGLAADYARVGDVKGRAVLVRRTLWPYYVILEAAEQGASAILIYDYPGENPDDTLKQDSVAYHDPLPTVVISRGDAVRLQAAAAAGPVSITLENRVDSSYGFSENVIGTLPGTEFPDEYVAVSAHHDRWHQGAQDNAIGVAVMLELARVLSASPPRRTLLLLSFGSEEAGAPLPTENDWLVGSYAFVKAHPEVTGRLVYAFNVDGAGWSGEEGYLFATLDNLPFQRRLLADLGLDRRVTVRAGVTNWVDAWSLGAIGGGAVSYLLWFEGHPVYRGPESFSRVYHTQSDVFRPEDYQNLEHDLRLGTLGLYRSDQALLAPIRLSRVAAWVEQSLTADAALAPDVGFEEALSAAREFGVEAEKLEKALASVKTPEWAALVNRWLMRARQDLVPWLLAGSSQEAVLRTSPYAADVKHLDGARSLAQHGDAEAAARSLEEVTSMDFGKLISNSTYLNERLHLVASNHWGNDFEQGTRLVHPAIHAVYRRLKGGADARAEAEPLTQLAAQARGHLQDALFIVAGKLRAAARALGETPLP